MGAGATYGWIIRETNDLSSSLEVTLASSVPQAATLPVSSVTILADTDRVAFWIDAVDDASLDGDQVTIISAASFDLQATASLTVLDDDDASLPPIEYAATRIALPSTVDPTLNDFNSLGMAVGGVEGASWYYDGTTIVKVNDLISDVGVGAAYGLNNTGLMVGSVMTNDGVQRGFVLDLLTLEISLLPHDDSGWVDSHASKVNDKGDILGWFQRTDGTWDMYLFNPADNALDIVNTVIGNPDFVHSNITNPPMEVLTKIVYEHWHQGYLFEYAWGDEQPTQLNPLSPNNGPVGRVLFSHINDFGDIAALETVAVQGSGKGKKSTELDSYLYRYWGDQQQAEELVQVTPPSFEVQSINNARTAWLNVHAADGTDYSLLHSDSDGFTALDALLSTGGVRVNTGIMNRDYLSGAVLGYSQIATWNESISVPGQWDLVILTPQPY
jgi:hypothetical protein